MLQRSSMSFQTVERKLTVWGVCYCARFCIELFLLSPGCCPKIPLELFAGNNTYTLS